MALKKIRHPKHRMVAIGWSKMSQARITPVMPLTPGYTVTVGQADEASAEKWLSATSLPSVAIVSSAPEGGSFYDPIDSLLASGRCDDGPANEDDVVGLRVARVPEPGSLTLLGVGALAFLAHARPVACPAPGRRSILASPPSDGKFSQAGLLVEVRPFSLASMVSGGCEKKGSGVFCRNGPVGCFAQKTPDPFFRNMLHHNNLNLPTHPKV